MIFRAGKILAALSLSLLLLVTACASPSAAPPTSTQAPKTSLQQPQDPKSANTQQPTTQAPTNQPLAGGKFNKFFPAASGDYQQVFAQEKTGFAEAKLKKNGEDIAVLSINDLANNPTAVQKYESSTKKIAGYPAAEVGTTQTALLVGNRFQVKVQSREDSFTASDREAWLQKFNLTGLSTLPPNNK
ncbi:MAG TPA: hypothetical protein DDZ80_18225 [Cyanobacteria bacterium UBA8803]|nr:hypothetical protein [Cyanobacteria bacterium UBA9273]HBL60320.1 hypothetical protein [Cyanobacteria bacterium UBA8803]